MKPSKILSTGAAVAAPVMLLGLVFSILLLLTPAKPAAADCRPAVSVVIDGSTKVEGYTQEQLRMPQRSWAPARHRIVCQRADDQRDGGPGGVGVAGAGYRRRRRPGLAGVVPAARQRRVGLLRRPHGPHHERHATSSRP